MAGAVRKKRVGTKAQAYLCLKRQDKTEAEIAGFMSVSEKAVSLGLSELGWYKSQSKGRDRGNNKTSLLLLSQAIEQLNHNSNTALLNATSRLCELEACVKVINTRLGIQADE